MLKFGFSFCLVCIKQYHVSEVYVSSLDMSHKIVEKLYKYGTVKYIQNWKQFNALYILGIIKLNLQGLWETWVTLLC
jgi:hypothetical protein